MSADDRCDAAPVPGDASDPNPMTTLAIVQALIALEETGCGLGESDDRETDELAARAVTTTMRAGIYDLKRRAVSNANA